MWTSRFLSLFPIISYIIFTGQAGKILATWQLRIWLTILNGAQLHILKLEDTGATAILDLELGRGFSAMHYREKT